MKTIRLDHSVVSVVFTADWHLSEIPPGKRTDTYADEILGKIHFVGELARKLKGVTLCGGDVWHQKRPQAAGNTFALANRLIEELRQHPFGRAFGTHGNHDIFQDRVDSLPAQPLGNLIAAQVYHDLSTESVIFENQDGSVRVQVDAYPFTSDDMAALERVLHAAPREPGVTHRVVLMHQYGDPGDAPSLYGHPTIGFNRMAGCDYDVALWGHDHSRTNTVTVGRTTHVRLGSLSRASLAEDEIDRPIAAAVFSFTPDGIKFREQFVPAKPLAVAFTIADRAVEKVRESDEVTQFFAKMNVAVAAIHSNDVREFVRSLCPPDEMDIFELTVDLCGL